MRRPAGNDPRSPSSVAATKASSDTSSSVTTPFSSMICGRHGPPPCAAMLPPCASVAVMDRPCIVALHSAPGGRWRKVTVAAVSIMMRGRVSVLVAPPAAALPCTLAANIWTVVAGLSDAPSSCCVTAFCNCKSAVDFSTSFGLCRSAVLVGLCLCGVLCCTLLRFNLWLPLC